MDRQNREADQDISDLLDHANTSAETIPLKKSAIKAAKLRAKKAAASLKHRRFSKRFLLSIGTLALLICAIFIIFRTHSSREISDHPPNPTTPDELYYSPLSGNEIKDKNLISGATTCVMIENSPDARPQSGLDQAGVIYEAIAEGGITRFMAIFQEGKPQYLGPVRSVRLTYAELAKPYQCGIAHVGGSGNALSLIRAAGSGYRDLDQFYNGGSYWRIGSRHAPHNVYTSFEKLDQLNYNKGFTSSNFTGFPRVNPDQTNTSPRDVTTIQITLSSALYNPVYRYDPTTNSYRRAFANGSAHLVQDQNGVTLQLSPKVVITMKVNAISRSGSREGYADYTTTGEGDVTIFQNGTVISGKWRRANNDSELHFVDSAGNDIPLERGQTWISLYPSGSGAVSWQ